MERYLTSEQVNAIYPVIGATLYPGGLVVQRLNMNPYQGIKKPKRGKVVYMSKRSRVNLMLRVNCHKSEFLSLMTLTYGVNFPRSGTQVKRDLNTFLTRLRQVYPALEYVWFLEFQRRGAPHLHLLTNLPGPEESERKWFGSMWARVACGGQDWPYTPVVLRAGRLWGEQELMTMQAVAFVHSRALAWEAVKVKDGAARYAAKYSFKTAQKQVPEDYQDVGRFWGSSKGMGLPTGEMVYGSEKEIRQLLWLKGRDFVKSDVLPKICLY